jgi:hypothetical protein
MFGTKLAMSFLKPNVYSVFARRDRIDALGALTHSLGSEIEISDITDAAIGIDSSVFLGLARLNNSADVIDSLGIAHTGPLILPGQAVQEFWNNQAASVETFSRNIKTRFDELRKACDKLSNEFLEFHAKFDDILKDFDKDFGQIYTSEALQGAKRALGVIEGKAIVPFADREKLSRLAAHRKSTKTPPGFKDSGDGDFFVWADFLTGLLDHGRPATYSKIILLTDDTKADWSRSGIAHPILRAEAMALLRKPFHVMTLQKLSQIIRQSQR